jgi:ABC-2 type transport system ATP-binding protein
MTQPKTVIDVKRLTKRFGKFTALDNVSFKVGAGEVVGFVGANGAGKTTTISTLLGFIGATEGVVRVFGSHISPNNAHITHRKIGYAAGDMQLPPRLTGGQYLSFVLHQAEGKHRERFEELCRRFQPVLDKKIKNLSRGNKQKIALIAAFVSEPELIILDEPTSGLDPVMQAVFLDLIREVSEQGVTVFMSSHYLEEVAEVCSRVILMRHGKVIEDLAAETLLEGSGKQVRIVTKYARTRPPKDATGVAVKTTEKGTELSFVHKAGAAELQRWIASVKQLEDIEVSEYDLGGAFKALYETEEEKTK